METQTPVDAPARAVLAPGDCAIPLLEGFAALGSKSATTGYKRMKSEPGFPQPFYVGRRGFLLQSEILAHLARLASQRDAKAVQA